MAEPLLAHNVYFTLIDNSPAARAKLLEACRKHLTGHPGTVFFACGTVEDSLRRPVNDLDFDVGLHILFENKAAHDAYQVAPRHEQFIEENRANWKKVRVFDSSVERA
ncbi:MAG TPA: Dabb family protein [Gemmataceae bacterium]|nr:Dabb family protein [Gemmataceae bacterium]